MDAFLSAFPAAALILNNLPGGDAAKPRLPRHMRNFYFKVRRREQRRSWELEPWGEVPCGCCSCSHFNFKSISSWSRAMVLRWPLAASKSARIGFSLLRATAGCLISISAEVFFGSFPRAVPVIFPTSAPPAGAGFKPSSMFD